MLTQILVPLIAAIIGGFVVHFLSAWRDRINKRREKKIDYLIDAYRQLEACGNRSYSNDQTIAQAEFKGLISRLESAAADIQLFGSPSQVELTKRFIREFAEHRTATTDDILQDLRQELRSELDLPEVPREVVYLRYREGK